MPAVLVFVDFASEPFGEQRNGLRSAGPQNITSLRLQAGGGGQAVAGHQPPGPGTVAATTASNRGGGAPKGEL